MSNFEAKFLDGPNVGYCSSSDDEQKGLHEESQNSSKRWSKCSKTERTGPKGVLADHELFKKEQLLEQQAKEEALFKEATRFTLENPQNSQIDEDEEEDELKRIRERRTQQLKSRAKGQILKIADRFEFLDLIEQHNSYNYLFISIFISGNERCEYLNSVLLEFSGIFKNKENFKFYKIESVVLGTSNKFTREALPVLQIYKTGQLIGNFICLDRELGNEDYDVQDLINFLKRFLFLIF